MLEKWNAVKQKNYIFSLLNILSLKNNKLVYDFRKTFYNGIEILI